MDLNGLSLFVHIADTGNISEAARLMGISTSLASRRLAALEQAMGSQLVVRTTRVSHLTAAGRLLSQWARDTLANYEAMTDEISHLNNEPRGTVRIATNEFMSGYRLPKIIAELGQAYPDIHVELIVSDTPCRLLDACDFAIHAGLRTEDNVYFRKLYTYTRRLCASPDYLARFGTPKRLEDLSSHRLLQYAADADAWLLQRNGRTYTHHANAHVRTNSFVALVNLVESGVGITRLSSALIKSGQKAGTLAPVLADYDAVYPHGEALAIWFAYADKSILKRTKLVMDFVAKRLP